MSFLTLKTAQVTFTPENDSEGTSAKDYSDVILGITLSPSTSTPKMAVSGKQQAGNSTWTLGLDLFQEVDTTGLLRFLLEHEGERYKVHCVLAEGADPIDFVVTLQAAQIGGAASNDIAESSVQLPVDGKPIWNTAG